MKILVMEMAKNRYLAKTTNIPKDSWKTCVIGGISTSSSLGLNVAAFFINTIRNTAKKFREELIN